MVRKNARPANTALVTDVQLDEARRQAAQAAARLAEVEKSDVTDPGWSDEIELATRNAKATARRLQALEALRATQLEQAGQRAAVAEAAAPEVAKMAAVLASSRDAIADAAAAHLVSLAALAMAAEAHNATLASFRSRLAELGLAVGEEVTEGTLGSDALVAAGITWQPVPADGFIASAVRQVLPAVMAPGNPFNAVTERSWLPSQLTRRRDGLAPPTLDAVGATAPKAPRRIPWRHAETLPSEDERRRLLAAQR